MAGIFGDFFLVSPFTRKRSTKTRKQISGKSRSKIRGKIRDENSKNSGNFRSATFLTKKEDNTKDKMPVDDT